jgi:hypothetical protein
MKKWQIIVIISSLSATLIGGIFVVNLVLKNREVVLNEAKVTEPEKIIKNDSRPEKISINTIKKDCMGIRFSYNPEELQIGYSETLSPELLSLSPSSQEAAKKTIFEINDGFCKLDANGEGNILLYPVGRQLPCIACDGLFNYISLSRNEVNREFKYVSDVRKIERNGVEFGNTFVFDTTKSDLPFASKELVFTFKIKGITYNLTAAQGDALNAYKKTDSEVKKQFQNIIDSIEVL